MWPLLLLLIYCVCLVTASLAGGWLPAIMRLTHTRMQLMLSLVGGLMIGVALLHLLPHAVVETESLDIASSACLIGLLAMFLTIRVFPVHQHCPDHADARAVHHAEHGHPELASAAAQEDPLGQHEESSQHRFSWLGLFLGLSIHTTIDGIAVAASVMAAAAHGSTVALLGAGTFLAVLLHKPLDSFSLMSLMVAGGWTARARNVVNAIFSLICPFGALMFFVSTREMSHGSHIAVGCALGFSAGVFLGIALADLLPEIQFHRHDRVKLTAALLFGVALAYAIGMFEPSHAHDTHPHEDHTESTLQMHAGES